MSKHHAYRSSVDHLVDDDAPVGEWPPAMEYKPMTGYEPALPRDPAQPVVQERPVCLVHNMPDCSPLLNGCSRLTAPEKYIETETKGR